MQKGTHGNPPRVPILQIYCLVDPTTRPDYRRALQRTMRYCMELVAETCGYSDLVTALGAAAAENSGSGFGGHANEKAVNFGAATAVRLECAFGHENDSC